MLYYNFVLMEAYKDLSLMETHKDLPLLPPHPRPPFIPVHAPSLMNLLALFGAPTTPVLVVIHLLCTPFWADWLEAVGTVGRGFNRLHAAETSGRMGCQDVMMVAWVGIEGGSWWKSSATREPSISGSKTYRKLNSSTLFHWSTRVGWKSDAVK